MLIFGKLTPSMQRLLTVVALLAIIDVLALGSGRADTYLTTHNYPTRANPTSDKARPSGGVQLTGPIVNLANFVFGRDTQGATVRNRADLDALFDYNGIFGNQLLSVGENGLDGLYANFRSRYRHYPAGDPEDKHVIGRDALYLKAACQGINHTDCGDGKIFTGMIRPYLDILPGTYTEVCYQADSGRYAWPVPWMFIGKQEAPTPGGNIYAEKRLHLSQIYHEIDLNDGFEINGLPRGHTLQAGEVWEGTPYQTTRPQIYKTAPHTVFLADDHGFRYDRERKTIVTETDLTSAVHCIALDWKGDGSHLLNFLLDGRVFRSDYYEYRPDTYVDGNGVAAPIPMHIMISNQVAAKFDDLRDIVDQGGVPDGWTMKVVSLKVWRNNATAVPSGSNAVGAP
jgi:hypothetical protein